MKQTIYQPDTAEVMSRYQVYTYLHFNINDNNKSLTLLPAITKAWQNLSITCGVLMSCNKIPK